MKKVAAALVMTGLTGLLASAGPAGPASASSAAGASGASGEEIVIGKTRCDRVGEKRVLGAGTMVKCDRSHVWERVGQRPGEDERPTA